MTALRTLLLAAALAPGLAAAHKPSDSYLSLQVGPNAVIQGQWDMALRDLDFALGLDADGNGEITWGEVRARHDAIASYALARLSLGMGSSGQPCSLKAGEQLVDQHTDGAYTVLAFSATCPSPGPGQAQSLELGYRLFADLDPSHRGLLRLQSAGHTRTAVLGPQAPQQVFELAATSRWAQLSDYLREGIWHIWIGFDHILFLLSLLLPAVLRWRRTRWESTPGFQPALVDVLKIVTAFTLAHSITLSLATLGWVALPSRLVESAIAASVVVAALNNVWPRLPGKRWVMAFAFGLIHGFGFASVLADLGLPGDALVLALVGFNVGVEVGQLAIVAVFLPLAFALRRTEFYRRGVMVGGSLLIATLALVWLVERAFDLKLLGL